MGIASAPPGGRQFDDHIAVVDPLYAPSSGAWAANNRGIWVRFRVDKPRSVTKVGVIVGGSSGNGVGGLYTFSGTQFDKLADSGSAAISGTNALFNFTIAAVALVPFVDYAAFVLMDNTTVTVWRYGLGSGSPVAVNSRCVCKDVGSTSAPQSQTVAGLTGGSALVPIIYLS